MVALVAALALLAVVCAPTLTAATGGPSSSVAGRLAHKVRAESEPIAATTTTPEPATPAVAAASPAAPVAPVTPAESNAAQQAETAMNDMIIAMVNALPNNTWTAGVNEYFKDASYEFLKSSCGLKLEASVLAAAQNQIPYPGSPYNPNAVVQPAPYQPAPYQPNPYQPSPYQPSPYQPSPYQPVQPSPYQPSPYQPTPAPTPAPVTPSVVQPSVSSLPVEFDARQKWGSTCPSVYDIRDQAGCGSCWAVSSAEVRRAKQTLPELCACARRLALYLPFLQALTILCVSYFLFVFACIRIQVMTDRTTTIAQTRQRNNSAVALTARQSGRTTTHSYSFFILCLLFVFPFPSGHCIASSGSHRPYISAKNILTCCGASCGSCAGGYPIEAFNMWKNGVVTGGNFGSTSSCQPYCQSHNSASKG